MATLSPVRSRPPAGTGKEARSMQEKNRENNQKNAQKEPSEQKNQKNDRK